MATVTAVTPTTSSTDTTSYASAAFTPAAGDLIVVFVVASGTVASTEPGTMTDSQGLGFSRVASFSDGGPRSVYCFVADALAAASSMTVTFDCTGDAATGCMIFPMLVSGMSRTGLSAIKQFASQTNQSAGGTPAPVFGANADTSNPTMGCVGNRTNPAGLTPPTNWTEGNDTGYATPTTGGETVYRDSGFTGTTITWGSTSATIFNDIIIELDTSSGVVEADASSSGAGTSSVVGAALWDSVSSAAGVAASSIVAVALWATNVSASGAGTASGAAVSIWDSVGTASGTGAASAVGENAAGGFTEVDGSASGTGAASAVAVALWATNSSAAGTGASSAVAVALWATNASATGAGVVSGISEAPEITIIAGQVTGSTARIGVASSTAKITVAGSSLDVESAE